MPEMFYTTEAIASDETLGAIHCAAHRRKIFRSFKRSGPLAIYHRKPLPAGPIALIEDNDLIEINIPGRRLQIVGVGGVFKTPEEIEKILEQRRTRLKPYPCKYKSGILKLFSDRAVSPMKGGYME